MWLLVGQVVLLQDFVEISASFVFHHHLKRSLFLHSSNVLLSSPTQRNIASQISFSLSSIRLSLNRKTEFKSSSPHDSLQSLGITSGNLIFYSIVSDSFSSQTLTSNSQVSDQESNRDFQSLGFDSTHSNFIVRILEAGEGFSSERMEIDDGSVGLVRSRFSETCFLKKVLKEALGDDDKNHKILLLASVHAVLLESGFVALDSISGMLINGFNLPDLGSTVSLFYTMPAIFGVPYDVVWLPLRGV